MKRSALLLLGLTAFSWAGATKSTCSFFSDTARYYQGPDDQILSIYMFQPAPLRLPPETEAYVTRLVEAIKSRGSHLVVVSAPQPGANFVGKLDANTIKGTPFDAASHRDVGIYHQAYLDTLSFLNKAGADVVDVQAALLDDQKAHPNDQLWFKHDSHWYPTAAKVAASSTADLVKQKYPDLVKQLASGPYQVVTEKTIDRVSLGGWDGIIKQTCPDHTPLAEPFPVLSLKSMASSGGDALLGDQESIVLFGTSYSAEPSHLGFDLYLSQYLGASVDNLAMEGGGALGSILEYYSTKDPKSPEPGLIVWENPITHFGEISSASELNALALRQVLPVAVPHHQQVMSVALPSLAPSNAVDVTRANAQGSSSYLEIKFDTFRTRKLTATLTYEDQTETVTLEHPRGSVTDRYDLELNPKAGKLIKVSFALSEKPSGKASVTLFKYQ